MEMVTPPRQTVVRLQGVCKSLSYQCLALGMLSIKGDCYYLLGLLLWASRCKFNDREGVGAGCGAPGRLRGPGPERAGPVSARIY